MRRHANEWAARVSHEIGNMPGAESVCELEGSSGVLGEGSRGRSARAGYLPAARTRGRPRNLGYPDAPAR